MQDTRLLLVVSNLVYLNKALIPGMLNQLQSSFGISLEEARRVSDMTNASLFLLSVDNRPFRRLLGE